MPSNIDLTTKVISLSGEIAVFAECEINKFYCRAEIKTKIDNRVLGRIRFGLKDEAQSLFNENIVIPKHVYIDNMVNVSEYKYVGSAMHELTFRLSVEWGAQGRIILEAVRDTHYFHYRNGFTLANSYHFPSSYYFNLARELILSGNKKITKNMGACKLHLSPDTIIKKLHQFNIPNDIQLHGSSDLHLNEEDMLMTEAKAKSLASKIMICLHTAFKKRKNRVNLPYGMRYSEICQLMLEEEKLYPSSPKTDVILTTGCRYIIDILPIDTLEKHKEFEIIVAAAIILSTAVQDREFGPQARYGNQLLNPQLTLEKLLKLGDEGFTSEQHFKQIGKAALIDKTIPFDGIVRDDLFPDLDLAPEFKTLFEKYQLTSSSVTSSTTEPSSSAEFAPQKINKQISYGNIPFWQTKQQVLQNADEFQINKNLW